ncbi:tyrosine-type recombinase/integrase [Azospirillum soli]|uniref:tyrosine-type recombinase/integrase n=1 Tax=Azospirillum soli TaxID=1304799 RepID=UPI001FE48DE6|nr:hypothetical protein [Azospirillum soli]MBP2316961.1 integrase [Azospirillum soli]
MLDRIVDRGAPMRANRVFAYVRKFFNWCVSRDLIAASPCVGVRPPTDERERDRVLSDEEMRLLWFASVRVGWPFGPFLRLLMLTAQRLNEVAGMRWSELDLELAMWTIPAERAKNGTAHLVPPLARCGQPHIVAASVRPVRLGIHNDRSHADLGVDARQSPNRGQCCVHHDGRGRCRRQEHGKRQTVGRLAFP